MTEFHPLAAGPGEPSFAVPANVQAICKGALEMETAPTTGYARAFAEHVAGGEPIGKATLAKLHHFLAGTKDEPTVKGGEESQESTVFHLMGGLPALEWTRAELIKAGDITPTGQGDKAEKVVSVLKVDEEIGMVFGWAIVCKDDGEDYFDTQDDHIPEGSMLKASADFMESSRLLGDMHQKAEGGSVVFCFPMTGDIAAAFGMTTRKTGLMIGVKPSNPETLAKFKSGEYSGFSIGGVRLVDEDAD